MACHDELSAADLVGRWLLDAEGTRWQDGPLALAARHGALCYLDVLAEARADTTVVIHPLADTRRMLPLTACNELLAAHPDFALVVSYNPGPLARELKVSTRQRFCALEFHYPVPEMEAAIVARESGLALDDAAAIVAFGVRTRRLQGHGLDDGASTRMLVHAVSSSPLSDASPTSPRAAGRSRAGPSRRSRSASSDAWNASASARRTRAA